MKHTLLFLMCILLVAFSGLSQGQVLLTFTPVGSTTISPGGEVTFDVNLTVSGGESVTGVDYYISAPNSNQFTLLNFDNSASTFNQFGPSDPDPQIDPNSVNLGASTLSPVGNGTYLLSQVTVQASPTLSAGSYDLTIFQGQSDWIDGSLNKESFSLPAASIEITVVPEPATGAMLMLGLLGGAVVLFHKRIRGNSSC